MFENERKPEFPMFDDCYQSIIEKFLTICLPVTTTPCVKIGKIKTECCGNPIISSRKHENCCEEMKDGCCKFTIIQKMKLEIPIDFNADTKVDDLFVDCEFRPDRCDKDDKHDKFDKYDKDEKYDYDKKEEDTKFC